MDEQSPRSVVHDRRTEVSESYWQVSPYDYFLYRSQDWFDKICYVNWKNGNSESTSNRHNEIIYSGNENITDTNENTLNFTKNRKNMKRRFLRPIEMEHASASIDHRTDTSSTRTQLNDSSSERIKRDQEFIEYFDRGNLTIPRSMALRDSGTSLFNSAGGCNQREDQVWLSYWDTIRASGIWNAADDASIHSDTISCADFSLDDSTGVMIAKDKADLSTLGDDDSTCCSNYSKEEGSNLTIHRAEDCIVSNAKLSSSKYSQPIEVGTHDLSKQIKSKLTESKGKVSSEKMKKILMKKLRIAVASRGRYDAEVGKLLVELADFHHAQDQIDISIMLQKEGLNIWYACYGDYDPKTIEAKVKIGRLYQEQGNNDEAINMYYQALRVTIEIDDTGIIPAADIRILMAEILDTNGRTKDAIKEMKRALNDYRKQFGDEHVKVASSVEKIASYYFQINSYSKANAIYGELIKLRVSLHGSQSFEVGKSLLLWAKTFEKLGDINKSMRLLKQGYIILHENKALNDVDDACALKSIGDLYTSIGNNKKAIKAYSSSLLIYRRSRGESHSDTAESYTVLGVALRTEKKFEKALKIFNCSLLIYRNLNDNSKHVNPMVDTLHEIGTTYKLMGKYQQALKAFSREHSIRKKIIPDEKYKLGRCMRDIGLVFFHIKKYDSSKKFLTKSLLSFDKSIGRNIEFAETLYDCARVLQEADKKNEAAEAYTDTLSILKANGKNSNDETIKEIVKLLVTEYPEIDILESNRTSLNCRLIDVQ